MLEVKPRDLLGFQELPVAVDGGSGDVEGVGDFDGADMAPMAELDALPSDSGIELAADPRDLPDGWLDEVISDAPPLTVRVEISCNVAAIQEDWDHARRVFSAFTPKTSQWLAQSIKPELLDAIDAVLPPQP